MNSIVEINLVQFSIVYVLLLIVLGIMKKGKINQSKLLIIASMRMTVQLILAGLLLTYIFKNPNPIFTVLYVVAMAVFSIHRALSRNSELGEWFKGPIVISLAGTGTFILFFFIVVVVGVDFLNPQYTIPIGGMVFGNAMTGVTLGLKTFHESLKSDRNRIQTLINLGVPPRRILSPISNNALETALMPTLNSMLGMGIISLPGMMTGQILSGTLPMTAILYQIAIMISICTAVCLATFCSLSLGSKKLYNKRNQIIFYDREN
ncbi:MAG: ABC transporter permease [Anaerovoracaceae bacterium]